MIDIINVNGLFSYMMLAFLGYFCIICYALAFFTSQICNGPSECEDAFIYLANLCLGLFLLVLAQHLWTGFEPSSEGFGDSKVVLKAIAPAALVGCFFAFKRFYPMLRFLK